MAKSGSTRESDQQQIQREAVGQQSVAQLEQQPSAAVRQGTAPSTPATPSEEKKVPNQEVLDLIKHMKDTGTPWERLRLLEPWVRANPGKPHEPVTGENLYRHMEAMTESGELTIGTLRKAGKFVFGPDFDPERVVAQAPTEEMQRLRSEADTYRNECECLRSEKIGLNLQNQFLREALDKAVSQISYLKTGRSKEELASIGL